MSIALARSLFVAFCSQSSRSSTLKCKKPAGVREHQDLLFSLGLCNCHFRSISTQQGPRDAPHRLLKPTTVSAVGRTHHRDNEERPHVLIAGSGWGALSALREIDQKQYRVTVVSPRDYFVFTPFLVGACVGSHEPRAAIEPIRGQSRGGLHYVHACITSIDFEAKTVCAETVEEVSYSGGEYFPSQFSVHDNSPVIETHLQFDKLVLACGAVVNTYNTPGVPQYAKFLKDVTDAQLVRATIMSLFARASMPETSEEERKKMLHFVVVGGGPTGVEFLGELNDLVKQDLGRAFHEDVFKCISMTLIDAAPKVLNAFHPTLQGYVYENLKRMGVNIRTQVTVKEVKHGSMIINDGEKIHFGLLLWAPGVAPTPLLKGIKATEVSKDERTGRLKTDRHCRVLRAGGKEDKDYDIYEDVFAIGDCAVIADMDLPPTAQVARQKGEWLGRTLNKAGPLMPIEKLPPFEFNDRGYMAYVGGWKAVVGLTVPWSRKRWLVTGQLGGFMWRFIYWTMLMSVRNRVLVPNYWTITWLFGREISLIKRHLKP